MDLVVVRQQREQVPGQITGGNELMRGSITRLSKKSGCGFILGEDGCEAYFDLASLDGIDIRALSLGIAVEYQEHFGHERLRAAKVRALAKSQSETAGQT